MNSDIVLYNFETVSGKFEIPIDNSLIPLNETTKNSISNAWEEYAVFDEFGRVWIISDKIHILLRTSRENAKYIDRTISALKQKRIKAFTLQYDELTGEILEYQSCEFSHIRSVSLFPQFASLIENGLIVNKKTHEEIALLLMIMISNSFTLKTQFLLPL